jgi:hypothetical protein
MKAIHKAPQVAALLHIVFLQSPLYSKDMFRFAHAHQKTRARFGCSPCRCRLCLDWKDLAIDTWSCFFLSNFRAQKAFCNAGTDAPSLFPKHRLLHRMYVSPRSWAQSNPRQTNASDTIHM